MKKELLRFKNKQKYIVFDYETCSLNTCSFENKPWQLAFLVCEGDKVISEHNLYPFWQDLNISEEAKKITGFKMPHYKKNASDPKDALGLLESYLYSSDYIIVGHNLLGFDIYIHNMHRLLCNKQTDYSYLDRLIDTNSLARALFNQIDLNDDTLLNWQFKLQKLRTRGVKSSLKHMCSHYKIEFDPSKLHDALYDIRQNFKVFQKLIWDIEL
jgi:DNA polymerase III epsilon subunit-like protein